MVYKTSRYQAALWLKSVLVGVVWRAVCMFWIDVELRPPEIIAHAAVREFVCRVFQYSSKMLHIRTKSVTTEAQDKMPFVNRYKNRFIVRIKLS